VGTGPLRLGQDGLLSTEYRVLYWPGRFATETHDRITTSYPPATTHPWSTRQ